MTIAKTTSNQASQPNHIKSSEQIEQDKKPKLKFKVPEDSQGSIIIFRLLETIMQGCVLNKLHNNFLFQKNTRNFFEFFFFPQKLSHILKLDCYKIYFMLIHLVFFIVHATSLPPSASSGFGKRHLLTRALARVT